MLLSVNYIAEQIVVEKKRIMEEKPGGLHPSY
jgi:hypothetical protein